MLNRPIVHELDSNAINAMYIRGLDINLHHKKLNAIRQRKNLYEIDPLIRLKKDSNSKNHVKRITPFYGINYSIVVQQDNLTLANKLSNIQNRDNKQLVDDQLSSIIKTRKKFSDSIRQLKKKQLLEDNRDFGIRLINRAGYIDVKKMEDDFKLNQRFLNQLRRIKPRNMSCENINRDKSKSTSRN